MARRLQVFVSSTYLDLKEERQAAVEAILEAKHIPAGMELFAAGNESQLKVIKKWIDESDVYMLILGHRYGSIEPESGNSYTHVEFDYAVLNGKQVFSVVMTDGWRKAKQAGPIDANSVIELEHPQKLKVFRGLVNERMWKPADDRKDIKLAVHQSLAEFTHDKSLVGWVRGDADDKRQELEKEIAGLKGELAAAQRQNTTLEGRLAKEKGGEEPDWEVVLAYLVNFKLNLLPFFQESDKIHLSINDVQFYEKANILNLLLIFRSRLVAGINSRPSESVDGVLVQHVMPHLTTYGLTENVKVPAGWSHERMRLSKRGNHFLVWLDQQAITNPSPKA